MMYHFNCKWLVILMCLAFCQKAPQLNTQSEELYSIQMHMHGAFGGEARSSMSGHNALAEQTGVDVIWWTDHDWRVALHSYISGWDFESEGLQGTFSVPKNSPLEIGKPPEEEVKIEMRSVPTKGKFTTRTVSTSQEQAFSGSRSLKYHLATGERDFQEIRYWLWTARSRAGRCLALGIETQLSIRLESPLTNDVQIIITFELSDQMPDYKTELNYVIAAELTEEMKRAADRKQIYILLDHTPGEWNTYTFPLTEHAKQYGLGGGDGCLNRLYIGMRVRNEEATAYFDDYRIEEEIPGPAAFEKEHEIAASFTKVKNYLGQEISYSAPHMNGFGPDVPLIDFQTYPQGMTAWERVHFVHRHNGIIALNHPAEFLDNNRATLRDIIMARAFDTDMMEVGWPKRHEEHMRIWDQCSLNKIYITGIGTSDSHNHTRGWLKGHNFVTWVYAPSVSENDLMKGLLRGRAFMGDPMLFKGRMDLVTQEGYRMGNVILTDSERHEVTLILEGLEESEHVIKVNINGVYRDSLSWAKDSFQKTYTVDTREDTFIRYEVFRDDRVILISNPIYFCRDMPEGEISSHRYVKHGTSL